VDIEQSPICIRVLIRAIQNAFVGLTEEALKDIDTLEGPLQQRLSMIQEINNILGEDRFVPKDRVEMVYANQIAEIFFVDLKARWGNHLAIDLTYSAAIYVYFFGWNYNDNPEFSTKLHNVIIYMIYELGNW
jgi:hypothetical protein